MNAFPRRLQTLRKNAHLSRKTLGELCGLSKNTIGLYECGKRRPTARSLEALADYFGVTVDYLLGRQK